MLSPLEKGENQEQIYLNLSSLKVDLIPPAPLLVGEGLGERLTELYWAGELLLCVLQAIENR
jgi:hypothetical protein